MIDIAWSQFTLVLAVALIFLGPKELPHALKILGQWVGWVRSQVRDFQNQAHSFIEEGNNQKDCFEENKQPSHQVYENPTDLGYNYSSDYNQVCKSRMSKEQNLTVIMGARCRHPWIKNPLKKEA